MNTLNHLLIGTIVYEYISEKYGLVLDRESFLKGNTCPDHSIAFLRPHRLRFCGRAVRKKTIRLCRRSTLNSRASKKLGILCHYYSDFLCRAHNPKFGKSLKAHVHYEEELLRFMEENYTLFSKIDYIPPVSAPDSAVEINRRMRLLLQEQPILFGDYETELLRAVRACAELVLFVSMRILFPAFSASPIPVPRAG